MNGLMPDTAAYAPGNTSSKKAAHSVQPKLTRTRGRVFDYIKASGMKGATSSEIASALDVLPYTAKPRCTELKDAGYIIDSGQERDNNQGSPETVWLVAPPGYVAPAPKEKKPKKDAVYRQALMECLAIAKTKHSTKAVWDIINLIDNVLTDTP